jgi:hypothetical protein
MRRGSRSSLYVSLKYTKRKYYMMLPAFLFSVLRDKGPYEFLLSCHDVSCLVIALFDLLFDPEGGRITALRNAELVP